MLQTNRLNLNTRRIVIFKWLMVVVPPVTVTLGHSLLGHSLPGHGSIWSLDRLIGTALVTLLALLIAYVYVEVLFKVLKGLQAEAVAREQRIVSIKAVMQERERLSRDLHDGVAQLVAHLLMRLDTIKELIRTDRRQEAVIELDRLHGVADEIYEDIADSITGLRIDLAERGLVSALQDYLDQFAKRHEMATALTADFAANGLSYPAALQIFRLVQEALTNVRKHADARSATVTLASDEEQLVIVIADDGQGFPLSRERDGKTRPLGMATMRERVEALGGALHVESKPGSGTRVTATVPLSAARQVDGYAPLPASIG